MYPPTNVLELEGQAQDWEKLIIYAKAAWKWAIEQIKISIFFEAAMFQGFDKTWGDMNVLCRRHNLHLKWNQKRQHSQVVKPSLEGNLGSMGLVLGMWGGRGPWFAGSRGMSLARVDLCYSLHGNVSRLRTPTSPRCGRVFMFLIHFGIGRVGIMSQIFYN